MATVETVVGRRAGERAEAARTAGFLLQVGGDRRQAQFWAAARRVPAAGGRSPVAPSCKYVRTGQEECSVLVLVVDVRHQREHHASASRGEAGRRQRWNATAAPNHQRRDTTPMATTPSGAGSPPGNLSGIVDLEIDQLDVRPDYPLAAVAVEIVNPTGDGVRFWLDLGVALDFALRMAGACAKLRGIIP
jgi:hypothetical protein